MAMVQAKKEKGEMVEAYQGLGFKTEGDINSILNSLEPKFKKYGIYSFHKNFEWEKNNTDILPGWDYIMSKSPIIKDLTLFTVRYGSHPKNLLPKRTIVPNPNSADKILATLLDVSDVEFQDLADFSFLPIHKGTIANAKGFSFININTFPEFKSPLIKKIGTQKAVIIRFTDEKKYVELTKPDYQFKAYGQTFYGIKTPDKSWDILATSSDQFLKSL